MPARGPAVSVPEVTDRRRPESSRAPARRPAGSMSPTDDQPPSPTGPFRTWKRIYAAVLVVAVLTYALLFLFSRAFAP